MLMLIPVVLLTSTMCMCFESAGCVLHAQRHEGEKMNA